MALLVMDVQAGIVSRFAQTGDFLARLPWWIGVFSPALQRFLLFLLHDYSPCLVSLENCGSLSARPGCAVLKGVTFPRN
jgi:hypothetical protein